MMKNEEVFDKLVQEIKQFNLERDWDQFHNPKDVFIALVGEVGELADCYRWLEKETIEEIKKVPEKKMHIEEEVADILIYLIILAYKMDIDLVDVGKSKLSKNRERYPISKAKGVRTNFIEGFKAK